MNTVTVEAAASEPTAVAASTHTPALDKVASAVHARRATQSGVADLRLQLAQLDARDEALIKQRTNPTLFWPILGTLAGFSLGTVLVPAGIGTVVSNRPSLQVDDDAGSGAARSIGFFLVGVGAVALLVGAVGAWGIRKIKRGRAQREREFQAIGQKRNELQLELYTASQP